MIPVVWGNALAADYKELWKQSVVSALGLKYGKADALKILANRSKYEEIQKLTGVPWWFIGVIHKMEAGLRFDRHLHNGDPLTARTKMVPAGRPLAMPASGHFPYTWQESALDALKLKSLDKNKDWSIAHALFLLEGYNGYGYRQYHPTVKSPYLWSMTSVYKKGKYVADGKWSSEAVSQQCGIACILKELKIFDANGNPIA